ncbi:cuticle protein 64-like [Anthonomus grandis grandis]|uniref:cuticle protein 64-like n=1 Tax=Anthonomus grandis grandis TaxID=2921223 RepID=UPI0021656CFA|nr:cuticle protein 64-like [Anthonomus grandis grandis]
MLFPSVPVVLAMLVACSLAAPGFLHSYSDIAVPVATSYSNRYDVHEHTVPIVKTYAAPYVTKVVEPAYGYADLYDGYGYGHDSYGHGWQFLIEPSKKMYQQLALVALCVISVAYGAPSPGYLGGYHALPAATSYSSRIDIHGPEYVKTYAAPVIAKTVVAAPIVKTVIPTVGYHHEPLLGYSSYGYGLGHGFGHGYGHDYGLGYGHGIGLEHGHYY